MNILKSVVELFRLKRVNQQIFVLTVMTITIPLLIISIMIYIFSVESVKREYENSSELILNNLSFNVDQYLQSIENGTLSIQMDDLLQGALVNWSKNKNDSEKFSIQDSNSIENFISTIGMSIKNVDSVQIYAGDHVFYSTLFSKTVYSVVNLEMKKWNKKKLHKKDDAFLLVSNNPFN